MTDNSPDPRDHQPPDRADFHDALQWCLPDLAARNAAIDRIMAPASPAPDCKNCGKPEADHSASSQSHCPGSKGESAYNPRWNVDRAPASPAPQGLDRRRPDGKPWVSLSSGDGHASTCPYFSQDAAKGNGFADCNCTGPDAPGADTREAGDRPRPEYPEGVPLSLKDWGPDWKPCKSCRSLHFHRWKFCPDCATPTDAALAPVASPPAPDLHRQQAWLEIQGAMEDSMLNPAQKCEFIGSILKGVLANPPKLGGYNE